MLKSDNIQVNMDVPTEPMTLPDYIESWRMKLWDHAFPSVFKGPEVFKKSDSFKDYKASDLAVKRVLHRLVVDHVYHL